MRTVGSSRFFSSDFLGPLLWPLCLLFVACGQGAVFDPASSNNRNGGSVDANANHPGSNTNDSGEPNDVAQQHQTNEPTQTPAAAGNDNWVGSWGTAVNLIDAQAFSGQTYRQIVYTSIGGTSARLRISNRFGDAGLVVQAVYLANSTGSDGVDTASQKAVTFGGSPSVTIKRMTEVDSDNIDFVVPAQGSLAISMYLPSWKGATTGHLFAFQTNYMAKGNLVDKAALTSPTQTTSSYFLRSLEVRNSAATGAIAVIGASITDGQGSAVGANKRWPNYLAARLQKANMTIGVINSGIAGNTMVSQSTYGQPLVERFAQDAINQRGVQWIIVCDCPINDFVHHSADLSAQTIAALQTVIKQAHAANIKLVCATLTPFGNYRDASPFSVAEQVKYNAFVQSKTSGCDAVVDFNAATRDPKTPSIYLAADDAGDHIHLSDQGKQAVANCMDLNIFR